VGDQEERGGSRRVEQTRKRYAPSGGQYHEPRRCIPFLGPFFHYPDSRAEVSDSKTRGTSVPPFLTVCHVAKPMITCCFASLGSLEASPIASFPLVCEGWARAAPPSLTG